jgi:hypothetical protein
LGIEERSTGARPAELELPTREIAQARGAPVGSRWEGVQGFGAPLSLRVADAEGAAVSGEW